MNDDISKFITNRPSTKTEFNIEKFKEEKSSLSEDSDLVNNISFNKSKTHKTFKNNKKGRSNYISNFLPFLSPKAIPLSKEEKNFATPKYDSNNIYNKIKLEKGTQIIPINKNILIINKNENSFKNNSFKLEDSIKENSNSLQLLKSNSQNILNNNTIIKNENEISNKNSLSNTLKKKNKENILSLKYLIYNQRNENKEQNSLSFRKSSYDRLFLNNNNKTNIRKRKNTSDFFYKKQNQNDKLNKSQLNNIVMDFSDFKEDNKEKEELKMMKIFYDLKDVIKEDEKYSFKKRLINYGFKRDIIFVRDKKDIISRNEENKNNTLKINNNNNLKVRPHSKSFIKH